MMAHQNAGTYANHRIEEYMSRDYRVPDDFERFLYVSQVLQADAVKMVNDRRSAVHGTLCLQAITLEGRVVSERKQLLTLPRNNATHVYTLPVVELIGHDKPEDVLFYITFKTDKATYYNIAYPMRQKEMNFRKPQFFTEISPISGGFSVSITSDVFARAVFLSIKGIDNHFSDNYFDILPGTTHTVEVKTGKTQAQFEKELKIQTLADDYPLRKD